MSGVISKVGRRLGLSEFMWLFPTLPPVGRRLKRFTTIATTYKEKMPNIAPRYYSFLFQIIRFGPRDYNLSHVVATA